MGPSWNQREHLGIGQKPKTKCSKLVDHPSESKAEVLSSSVERCLWLVSNHLPPSQPETAAVKPWRLTLNNFHCAFPQHPIHPLPEGKVLLRVENVFSEMTDEEARWQTRREVDTLPLEHLLPRSPLHITAMLPIGLTGTRILSAEGGKECHLKHPPPFLLPLPPF